MVGSSDEMASHGQLPSSLSLLGAPDTMIDIGKAPWNYPQTMQIELARETVKDMQRQVKQGKSIQLHFGKNPTLQYGTNSKPLHISPTVFRTEVYLSTSSPSSLKFGALVSHLIAVEDMAAQADQSMAGTDDALAKLKSSLAGLQQNRENNQATFIDRVPTKDELARKSKGFRSSLFARSGLKQKIRPPINPASSISGLNKNGLKSINSSQGGAAIATSSFSAAQSMAARKPLIHLLAMRPMSAALILKKTRIPDANCRAMLQKVANKSPAADEWALADRYFKDLDVWSFPYKSKEDREAAIENAVKAYDRMRVSREDKLWQFLLPKEERGKGIVLSKIKFRPGVGNAKQAPSNTVNTAENATAVKASQGSVSPSVGKPEGIGKPLPSDHRSMLASIDGGQPMVRSTSNESARGHVRKTSDMEKRLFAKTKKPDTPLSRPTSGVAQSKKATDAKPSKKTAVETSEKIEKTGKVDKKPDVKPEKAEKATKSDGPEKSAKADKADKAEKRERGGKALKPVKAEVITQKVVIAETPEKKPAATARPPARKAPVTSSNSQSSVPTTSPSSGSEEIHKQVNGKKRKAEDDLESSQSRIKALKKEYNQASSEYLQLRTEVDQLKSVPQSRLNEVWDKYNKYNKLAKRVKALEEGLASPIRGLQYDLSPRTRSYLEDKLEKISQEYKRRRNEVDERNCSEDEKEELHSMFDEIQGLKKICSGWS